jgi:alpha-glucosidase
MYYGEELGMRTTDPTRIEDVHDPIGRLGWPKEKGRDGERTPMQWDDTANAAFTTGRPWLKAPASSKQYNVESESKDPESILNCYKRLLSLRKSDSALRYGEQVSLNNNDPDVFAFLRRNGNETVLVALNMSGKSRTIQFDFETAGAHGSKLTPLYSSPQFNTDRWDRIELAAFGAFVARLE